MRTRWIVLTVLIVLGVLVLLTIRSRFGSHTAQPATTTSPTNASPAATPSPAAAPAPSSQQQLAAEIRKNGVTPERAKMLFSMVVGPLPGVTVPAQGRDRSDFDGTLAVGYLYQVRNSLTPEQQKAAEQLIAGSSTSNNNGPAPPPRSAMFLN